MNFTQLPASTWNVAYTDGISRTCAYGGITRTYCAVWSVNVGKKAADPLAYLYGVKTT